MTGPTDDIRATRQHKRCGGVGDRWRIRRTDELRDQEIGPAGIVSVELLRRRQRRFLILRQQSMAETLQVAVEGFFKAPIDGLQHLRQRAVHSAHLLRPTEQRTSARGVPFEPRFEIG
jgi:hypothetical protein